VFDLITQSMLFILESLKNLFGNYGLAIIALTLLVRIVLWPVSQSQMKSMKMMQTLQPKMKALQERFKSDPQKMQAEMMKLYKDHKFNPLGGCLPMLVQIPLFLGLYWAISNPTFMAAGTDPIFLNLIHLKHTGVMSHGGPAGDGKMTLAEGGMKGFLGFGKESVHPEKAITVTLKNGKILSNKEIPNLGKSVDVLPKDLEAGVPVKITTSYSRLGLEGYEGLISKIDMPILNGSTKELETVTFTPQGQKARMTATLETVPGKTIPHWDILVLVLIFGASMIVSQKLTNSQMASTGNDQQQQMMKMMPIMFSVMMFMIPIPAGVLLYMGTNSVFQLFQTWAFQKMSEKENGTTPPSRTVLDVNPESGKA